MSRKYAIEFDGQFANCDYLKINDMTIEQIRADAIDDFASKLKDYVVTKRMQGIEPYWAVAVYEVSEQLKGQK